MAVKGIGSNYLYPVQNDYKLDSKTEDTKKCCFPDCGAEGRSKLRKDNTGFCIGRT